ncbi:MAG: hypothetical protein ACLQIQ_10510 [Beijerinckiaceae bacterium]
MIARSATRGKSSDDNFATGSGPCQNHWSSKTALNMNKLLNISACLKDHPEGFRKITVLPICSPARAAMGREIARVAQELGHVLPDFVSPQPPRSRQPKHSSKDMWQC